MEKYNHFVGNGREMLVKRAMGEKSEDKALFDKYFPIYRSEIKRYKHLIKGADYSKKHKLAAFLLVHFPHLFAFVTERIL